MKVQSKKDALLDDIVGHDWRQTSAVNSTAAAKLVPVALRDLMSTDEEARDKAYHQMTTVVWHQGTLYPIAADALAFLVRMLGLGEELPLGADFHVAYLVALFSLSARGASLGHQGCGEVKVGEQVLSVVQTGEAVEVCLDFLRSRQGTDAKQNILVALSQTVPTSVVVESLLFDASLASLWQRLLAMDYDHVWATFETLGESHDDGSTSNG